MNHRAFHPPSRLIAAVTYCSLLIWGLTPQHLRAHEGSSPVVTGQAGNHLSDPAYCLLDSVSLDGVSEYDQELLASCLERYHAAVSDTSRLKQLQILAEELNSEALWLRYNRLMLKLAEENLARNDLTEKREERMIWQWYASAVNNCGFLEQSHGNFDQALDYYNRCLKIQERISDRGGMATTYSNIGIVLEDRGEISLAHDRYGKSLAIRNEMHDSAGIAVCLNNLGAVYYNQGDIEKALEFWNRSLVIKEKIGDKGSAAYTLNNLGQIYTDQGDVLNGLKYYERSLSLNNEVGNKKGSALALGNIGASYNKLGNQDKALESYRKSLDMRTELEDKWGMAHAHYNISAVYFDMGTISDTGSRKAHLDASLAESRLGLELAIEMKDKQLTSVGYGYVAQTELALGLLLEALVDAEHSLHLTEELGYPEKISEAARLLYLIQKKHGKWEESLTSFLHF